jgi:hypothetical protein
MNEPTKKTSRRRLPEEALWSIFHCLALGTLVMSHGNEDYLIPKWNKEIVHFDIKQENREFAKRRPTFILEPRILIRLVVLLGATTTDVEHLGNSPLKVRQVEQS